MKTQSSFRGGQLRRIDELKPYSTGAPRSTTYIELSWRTGLKPAPKEHPHYMPSFVAMVEDVATESGLFADSVTVRPQKAKDYTLRMSMLNHGNRLAASCLGAISGATLTVIPAYARDNYRLTVSVHDATGSKLNEYEYNDHVNSWIWLPLLPVAPFTEDVDDRVRKNMVRHFFADLKTDGIIKGHK